MCSAVSGAHFALGSGITSTVIARVRALRASIRLPASSIGAKWPMPQTGIKTTVGVAIAVSRVKSTLT
jgi:hypothetical protein